MRSDDTYRLGALLSAGIDPEKAKGLVTLIRSAQAAKDAGEAADKLIRIMHHLVGAGVSRYLAYAVTFGHPSDHEPHHKIGSQFINHNDKEAMDAHSAQPQL